MIRRALSLWSVAGLFATAAFAQSCLPGASWCSGAYSYDAAGNIREIGNDVYIYDTAGRLVSGTADQQRNPQGVSRQDYSYDAFGNRISASRANGSVDCPGGCELPVTIDSNTNHITSNNVQYDDAGNLTFIHNLVGTTTYEATYSYDTAGRLTRATANTDDRQFLYTADDERIATANGATWTWTIRGLDGKVLREFTSMPDSNTGLPTANRQWAKDYVWRDGLLLASVAPTTPGANTTHTQHFHVDHLGTPRLVTADNGVQIGIHAYYPFGAELNLGFNEQPNELMKFTGHERDVLASDPHTLDDMHARFEMGTMGRCLSVDPVLDTAVALKNPQGWNRYAYVRNNPINKTDPTGRCEDPGKGEGGTRICIQPYIPTKTFSIFKGDGRGPQANGGAFRASQTLTLTAGGHGAAKQDFKPGVSQSGSAKRDAEVAKQDVNGTPQGVNVQLKASDGLLFGAAPNIGYNLTLKPTADGLKVTGTHSGYPALEVWKYQDGQTPQLLYNYDPPAKDFVGATAAIGQTVAIPEDQP